MNEQRYFLRFEYIALDANNEFLAAKAIKILHGFVKRHDLNDIGVSFPKWSADGVGNQITFVSKNRVNLAELLQQPFFAISIQHKIIKLDQFDIVPKDIAEVRFVRNQRINRMFAKDIQRREIRFAKRNEEPHSYQSPREKHERHFHRLELSSKSSQQNNFVLFVQQENVSELCSDHYNSYGLATLEKHRSTVPLI